jgi:aminobenzoyl-glutamate utilization protein B
VIKDGGDQPNVVPRTAMVWYYFRETSYPRIKELFDLGNTMASAAAQMTSVKLNPVRIVGSAWPVHSNKPLAEAAYKNIQAVGLPKWSDDDQTLAKAVQQELKVPATGLASTVEKLGTPVPDSLNRGGGSDDIGDVSWNVPTITVNFPSNIPNLPGHNWSNAISMATPIAHKGATAGAKVVGMTMLDALAQPALVDSAWSYFRNVQTKDQPYVPFITAQDRPAVELNEAIMAKYREKMRPLYFDRSRYKTYLEQLGIKYPTVSRP